MGLGESHLLTLLWQLGLQGLTQLNGFAWFVVRTKHSDETAGPASPMPVALSKLWLLVPASLGTVPHPPGSLPTLL